jgi:hypothetical protein
LNPDEDGSSVPQPVAWINASERGARLSHESLRTGLDYAHAQILDDVCAIVPISQVSVDDERQIHGAQLLDRLKSTLGKLLPTLCSQRRLLGMADV